MQKLFLFISSLIVSLILFVSPVKAQPQFITEEETTINTDINNDVFIGASKVSLSGNIHGDVFIGAGEVIISGTINEDLIIASGTVVLTEDAQVNGYILAGAGQLDIAGQVNGPVYAGVGNLIILPTAVLNHDLKVNTGEAEISDQAIIKGEKKIIKSDRASSQIDKKQLRRFLRGGQYAFMITSFVSSLLVLLLMIKIMLPILKKITNTAFKSTIGTIGWGFVKLILTPIAVILLLITIIGAPLGLIVLFLYGLKLYLAKLVTAFILGQYLVKQKWLTNKNIYLQSIFGLLLLTGLSYLPFIGPFVKLTSLLLGLGALFTWEKSLFRDKKQT